MSNEVSTVPVEVMGKLYQVKCPTAEIKSLRQAAKYLEDKILEARNAGGLNADRLIVITALNVVNQLLALEQQKSNFWGLVNHRVIALQNKIDHAFLESKQLEFNTGE